MIRRDHGRTLPTVLALTLLLAAAGAFAWRALTAVPAPRLPAANTGPSGETGGKGGRRPIVIDPASERPEATMDLFVPADRRTDLSPILVQAAEWPAVAALKPAPPTPAGEIPAVEIRNLRDLVQQWLAKQVQPDDFESALGKDENGRLFVRLKTPPGTRLSGRASCDMVPGMVTFAFAFDFPDAKGPVTIEEILSRLRAILPHPVLAELEKPKHAPIPHPSIAGADAFSAIAGLDRSGLGMIHPYLYLFATPNRLMGVFQQIPHGMAPDAK